MNDDIHNLCLYIKIDRALRLYDILKDKVKFKEYICSYTCEMHTTNVDDYINNCELFREYLSNENRCQQCIDIFGELK